MPVWLTITLPIATLALGTGGALAWVRYFRTEVAAADATTLDTLASAKLKDAQATEVIAQAFTETLGQVRQLAEDRAKENLALREDVAEAQKKIAGLELDVSSLRRALEELRHFMSDRGEHGEWDERAHAAARHHDPKFPLWPPPPGP